MTVDTDGLDATVGAVSVAARYLADGVLDLALVVGINGNSTPEFADLVRSPSPRRPRWPRARSPSR